MKCLLKTKKIKKTSNSTNSHSCQVQLEAQGACVETLIASVSSGGHQVVAI